jgi:hypothetical protein
LGIILCKHYKSFSCKCCCIKFFAAKISVKGGWVLGCKWAYKKGPNSRVTVKIFNLYFWQDQSLFAID